MDTCAVKSDESHVTAPAVHKFHFPADIDENKWGWIKLSELLDLVNVMREERAQPKLETISDLGMTYQRLAYRNTEEADQDGFRWLSLVDWEGGLWLPINVMSWLHKLFEGVPYGACYAPAGWGKRIIEYIKSGEDDLTSTNLAEMNTLPAQFREIRFRKL